MKKASKSKPKHKSNVKAAVKKVKRSIKSSIKAVKKSKDNVSPLRILSDKQMEQLKKAHKSGGHTAKQLAEKFKVSISTLYNYLNR